MRTLRLIAIWFVAALSPVLSETAKAERIVLPRADTDVPEAVMTITSDVGQERLVAMGVLVASSKTCGYVLTSEAILRDGRARLTVWDARGRGWEALPTSSDFGPGTIVLAIADPGVPPIPISAVSLPQEEVFVVTRDDAHRMRLLPAEVDGADRVVPKASRQPLPLGAPVFDTKRQLVGVLRSVHGNTCWITRRPGIPVETVGETEPERDVRGGFEAGAWSARSEPSSRQQEDQADAGLSLDPWMLILRRAAVALGWSTPPSIALWVAARVLTALLRRRRDRRSENRSQGGNDAAFSDAYASQLAAVYQLSGRSTVADATLGRQYDEVTREAEASSDANMARWARQMRQRVAKQFYRIHGTQPAPAEPIEEEK